MARVTPPLGAFGQYTLKAPFNTAANMSYRCSALRRVEELVKQNINILKTIYEPHGLTEDVYKADLALGVVFVSLVGTNGARIIVPDTYIESYPDQSVVNYSYTVLAVDFGPQPSSFAVGTVMGELKDVAAKYTGIDPAHITVTDHRATSTTAMTQDEYIKAEAARQNAIKNVKTKDEIIKEKDKIIQEQDKIIQELAAQVAGG